MTFDNDVWPLLTGKVHNSKCVKCTEYKFKERMVEELMISGYHLRTQSATHSHTQTITKEVLS